MIPKAPVPTWFELYMQDILLEPCELEEAKLYIGSGEDYCPQLAEDVAICNAHLTNDHIFY